MGRTQIEPNLHLGLFASANSNPNATASVTNLQSHSGSSSHIVACPTILDSTLRTWAFRAVSPGWCVRVRFPPASTKSQLVDRRPNMNYLANQT